MMTKVEHQDSSIAQNPRRKKGKKVLKILKQNYFIG